VDVADAAVCDGGESVGVADVGGTVAVGEGTGDVAGHLLVVAVVLLAEGVDRSR
jgi:hypothetical protein